MFGRGAKARFLRECESMTQGGLRARTPEGELVFGTGEAELVVRDWAAVRGGLVEMLGGGSYAKGLWDSPRIEDFARVVMANFDVPPRAAPKLAAGVGNEFYLAWLDRSMTYSAGLFAGEEDLGAAQDRKNDRVLEQFGGGGRMLDLNCGWGGLAERAAERGFSVTGLTVSAQCKGYADARLDGRAEILLRDHRAEVGRYDHVAAIEPEDGTDVLPSIAARLTERGIAVVQLVTTAGVDVKRAVEQAGLKGEAFVFGRETAATWREWGARLESRGRRLADMGFKAEVLRDWALHFATRAAAVGMGRAEVTQWRLVHA